MTNQIFLSSTLEKTLSRIGEAPSSAAGADKIILAHIKSSRRDCLKILSGFENNLDLLEHSLTETQNVIALLEEAGGQTIRARNMAEEKDGLEKYRDKISECAEWYQRTLSRLRELVSRAGESKDVNLLKGETLSIRFDVAGKSCLDTLGLDLTPEGLGIRDPDFTSLHSIQNSRIDIANGIDLAVTLKNMISSDIATIKTRREFCEITMSYLTQAQDHLSSPTASASDQEALLPLIEACQDFNAEESMAFETQSVQLETLKIQ